MKTDARQLQATRPLMMTHPLRQAVVSPTKVVVSRGARLPITSGDVGEWLQAAAETRMRAPTTAGRRSFEMLRIVRSVLRERCIYARTF